MKAISPELKAHYASGSTTIARCWRFECADGTTRLVTTASRDLLINGELYRSKDGVNPTAIQAQDNAAVPNSEVMGALSPDLVTETQILGAIWDAAKVVIFEVNYRDLSMGTLELQSGTIGDIKVGRIIFSGEVRGLAQALQQTVGDVYTKGCTARFGDARCKVNTDALMVTGSITSVVDRRHFADASRTEVPDYFGAGLITFTSGENAGYSLEIAQYLDGAIEPVLPFPQNVAVGDTYEMIPGCRKRFQEDCKTKWSNVLNFRGFPYVPGGDIVLGLGGTEGTNL